MAILPNKDLVPLSRAVESGSFPGNGGSRVAEATEPQGRHGTTSPGEQDGQGRRLWHLGAQTFGL